MERFDEASGEIEMSRYGGQEPKMRSREEMELKLAELKRRRERIQDGTYRFLSTGSKEERALHDNLCGHMIWALNWALGNVDEL
jgi:hypothetical protein